MDIYGDHCLVCSCGGDRTKRHHLLRNETFHLCSAAGLAPELEKPGLLRQRPDLGGAPEDGSSSDNSSSSDGENSSDSSSNDDSSCSNSESSFSEDHKLYQPNSPFIDLNLGDLGGTQPFQEDFSGSAQKKEVAGAGSKLSTPNFKDQ